MMSNTILKVLANEIRKEKEMRDLKLESKRQNSRYLQLIYKKATERIDQILN